MPHQDISPLTPLQMGILFHALREPRDGTYVEQISCLIEGHLDESAFSRAWQRLVDWHDALRTGFEWRSAAQQVIHSEAVASVRMVDCTGRPGIDGVVADFCRRERA